MSNKCTNSAIGWSEQEIIDDAKQFKTRNEWLKARPALSARAYYKQFITKIYKFLIEDKKAYSLDEIREDAKKHATISSWRSAGAKLIADGGSSHFRIAYNAGKEFYSKCVSHMVRKKHVLTKPPTLRVPAEDVKASAKLYQHKSQWKNSIHNSHYQVAVTRGSDFFNECTAHMIPAENPYAGDYIIYAYEFPDNHVYVGLTFHPERRQLDHQRHGQVHKHVNETGLSPTYKVVQSEVQTPKEAAESEDRWVETYRELGWNILNVATPGGIGTVARKWTYDLLILEAKKYTARKAWYDGNQYSYMMAKKMGIYEEVCEEAGLVRYKAVAIRVVSDEAKKNMALAKLGKKCSEEHKKAMSVAQTQSWAVRDWDKQKILARVTELGVAEYKKDLKLMAAIKRLKVKVAVGDAVQFVVVPC